MVSNKKKIEFYKKQKSTDTTIRKNIKREGHILFGAQAVNAHLPAFLDGPTEDYDVLTKNPRKSARKLERNLDNNFNADVFETKPARSPGTFRVFSKVTGRAVADFSPLKKQRATKKIRGIKTLTLREIKINRRASLNNPESRFRHQKDRETLQRIRIHQEQIKQRKATLRQRSNVRSRNNVSTNLIRSIKRTSRKVRL